MPEDVVRQQPEPGQPMSPQAQPVAQSFDVVKEAPPNAVDPAQSAAPSSETEVTPAPQQPKYKKPKSTKPIGVILVAIIICTVLIAGVIYLQLNSQSSTNAPINRATY